MTSSPENSAQALSPHRDRASVLGEVHARPFRPIETPARLVHFAFQSVEPDRDAERRILSALCEEKGHEPIPAHARHHRVSFENVHLRWERHNEFTTYCWYYKHPGPEGFSLAAASMAPEMYTLPQPGPHLVAVDLHIVEASSIPELDTIFAKEPLCVMTAEKGAVTVATDFKPDNRGFVKILVINTDVPAMRIGALVQRLLELETYRLLALLCLPEAQRLEPSIREIENSLVETTQEMTGALALEDNERLLDKLVVLAARLEAGAAKSLFRFGASRAYQNIVLGRIGAIGFEPVADRETFPAFLSRRMAPALQTCFSIEERQINLSRKLARATQLLRAKVDVAMEKQNRDILERMSERAQLQLRLQQTVEGLSIAAVSYYVVGLLGYTFKGVFHTLHFSNDELAMSILSPIAIVAVALFVRHRTRHPHSAPKHPSRT
ncbi:DUF3422 domain-containing protein [Agrobacterium tumefaciens]|uniref:Uncharacterized protein n=1 Tax=Agrobacterium tumefaciens TaxID=358 RepID=A0A2Z2Q2M0_AGRTU|nr:MULTISPECIES: DUF3422 domain-containing protein [Agrobacterium]ASK49010.1 hypothetical protein [Agrobacterium radiobacter]MCF1480202.1 DUF3422 domain-containing protein [Agrobacterium vitis]NTA48936.1 DUF3422 domain-containing protein [Agrobacterium tumefaciens]UXS41549.1 DUF3422 domain-containing protein [Agrobacterium tumefaciens]